MATHGANVAFPKTPYVVYQFLKNCGVCTTKPLSPKSTSSSSFTPTTCNAILATEPTFEDEIEDSKPTTCAAIVSSKKAPLYPPRRDTNNVRRPGKRNNKCKLCQKDHHHLQCPHRGEEWSPIYIRQRVAKHKAMYPDEKPDPAYINQSPPLLEATTKSYAKSANITIMEDSDDVFVDAVEEIVDNEDEDNDILEPEIKMADFNYDE